MSHQHLHQSLAYRTLVDFVVSLSYTDFSTIVYDDVELLLEKAGMDFQMEAYLFEATPYPVYAASLLFEIVQESGHRNKIRFDFNYERILVEYQLRTSL